METETPSNGNDMTTLAANARALLTATADVAGEQVVEARKRLAVALGETKELYDRARDKAVEGAHAAGVAVHEHPYQSIAIGIGVGALLGFLLARQCSGRAG